MKFSTNYIFYPDSQFLERALASAKSYLEDPSILNLEPVDDVTFRDTSAHMQGNYGQSIYSMNALPNVRDSLENKIQQCSREDDSQVWGQLHNTLGNVYAALAQMINDPSLYQKAIDLFNIALESFDQTDSADDWALSHYNRATASQELGRINQDKQLLKTATDGYIDALLVWTKDDNPKEWSDTMFQLGSAFHLYGNLLTGNRTHQKAVVSFKNALTTLDADNHALELAATHNSRGAVLLNLAESEENPGRVEEAIRSYETSLTILMEQQKPFHLAVLCRVNIATARFALAQLNNDAVLAEEVADSFELIIACFDEAAEPSVLAVCEERLKLAQEFTPN